MSYTTWITALVLMASIYVVPVVVWRRRPKYDSLAYQACFWFTSFAVFAVTSLAFEASFLASLLIGIAIAHVTALSLLGLPESGTDCL